MHPSRRRKKRPNYGIRTVEVLRGPNGFGFTISGQQPCILSCIVTNSPADQAGLRAGDFLISVNGASVSKITHDAVVSLIGSSVGPIRMTIAENYYSDSSDEELDVNRMINGRKPKYVHKQKMSNNRQQQQHHHHPHHHHHNHRSYKEGIRRTSTESENKKPFLNVDVYEGGDGDSITVNLSNPLPMEDEAGPIEYKALVGYLGTIEMPKQLMPNARLSTVCSCIRKLRQENRVPTLILITILPTCLTLKNSSNHILAIYPTNRVVYIGSTADKESRYFGLVTSAICDSRSESSNIWQRTDADKKGIDNVIEEEVEISNSCHVFVTDPKMIEHKAHLKRAENFKINCTTDVVTGDCLEFPRNALYIVSLIQNMYKLQSNDPMMNKADEENLGPLQANSPHPSASSNSDSGIGFRDDCGGNISDRILVVEFPAHRSPPKIHPSTNGSNGNNRPSAIDASHLEAIDLSVDNFKLNNLRCKNMAINDLSKQINNLNNVRACENVNIKNVLELESQSFSKNDFFLTKRNNDNTEIDGDGGGKSTVDRLNCRAMLDKRSTRSRSSVSSDDNLPNTAQIYNERAIDVPDSCKKSSDSVTDGVDFTSSVDNISIGSAKSGADNKSVFKTPNAIFFDNRRTLKRQHKMINSCDHLDKYDEKNYKLSVKVYGLSKPNHVSCEELNNFDCVTEKYAGYGSLQELSKWGEQVQNKNRRNIAQSEPDVRLSRIGRENDDFQCEQNGISNSSYAEGAIAWGNSFERLLDDPLGLHTFAEFLKKEFSAENIYFWTSCERYRCLSAGPERLAEAQRIYRRHLCAGAPEPVNVDSQARQCAEQSLENAKIDIFDQAEKQIFNLMKFDSYPRFLKSNLYQKCLSGDLEKFQLDAGLSLQPVVNSATPSRLKKSLSNAEDRRRKSLLPWHRKNRSKSKDRGESEYNQRKTDGGDIECQQQTMKESMSSSRSSLTSLDLALTTSVAQDSNKGSQRDLSVSSSTIGKNALCRVILSNGSTTVVQIKKSETIRQLVNRLLEKRGLSYSSFEVFTDKYPKCLDINEPSLKLAGCEVTVEQRIVFKLDLPNRKVISVKSKHTKIIIDVLRPILHKYNYDLDGAIVTLTDNELIDLHLPVTSIDGARLGIRYCDDVSNYPIRHPMIKINDQLKVNKLEEITNQVFEGILQEKADSARFKQKSDRGSVKSEDWGSEHSSGIFGRFLRRDSAMHDRKKKSLIPRSKPNPTVSSAEDENQVMKRPLIAKLKSGVCKLQVACSESDELVEGLTRAQRSRLEDQRGTKINFELPDFLKDKQTERNFRHLSDVKQNQTSPEKSHDQPPSNYENRNITMNNSKTTICDTTININNNNNNNAGHYGKVNNLRIYSPNKYLSDDSCKSNESTPSKCSALEETVIERKLDSPKVQSEPPPLPPKPKIMPIKPPNWGQNGFLKNKDIGVDRSKTLYLEQPSSSFV